MHRIARRDLLRMRMACQFESHQRHPERIAFSYELAQDCSVNGEARSLSLNNGSVDGNPAVESCPAPYYAIPAKHARFDRLAIGKANHERDNPGRRKIDTGDLLLSIVQNRAEGQFVPPQMRPKNAAVTRRQRRQKMVG